MKMADLRIGSLSLTSTIAVLTGIGSLLYVAVIGTQAIDTMASENRTKIAEHEIKIIGIEAKVRQNEIDHDLLLEIKGDTRVLREAIEALRHGQLKGPN